MKELVELYKKKLRDDYNNPDNHAGCSSADCDYVHLMWMLDEIPNMTDELKQNRWLGFVQGVFWDMGIYTIDEMREHVRDRLPAKLPCRTNA